MILTSLDMQNYKKYKAYRLEFKEGLTGIIGRNGVGKSTIFDAITFALYGDVRGEKETIRHAKAGEKEIVSVTLEFEIEGKEYRVKREMRGKTLVAKAYLYDGADTLIAKSAKGVSLEIAKLIGMNKEAFMHTVFASQKELTALSGLKNEDRKKIIRKLLGLEKIDNIEKEIRFKLTELNRDIKSFEELLLSKEKVAVLQSDKEAYTKIYESLQKDIVKIQKEYDDISLEIKEVLKELKIVKELKEDYSRLETNLKIIKTNLENLDKNQQERVKKLQSLKEQERLYQKDKTIMGIYKELEKTLLILQSQKEQQLKKEGIEKEQDVLREQYEYAKDEIGELKKKLEKKAGLHSQKERQEKLLEEAQSKIKEIEQEALTLKEEIAKYQGLIDNANKQIAKIEHIGKESNCPTCTRPLLDAYDNVIHALKKEIDRLYKDEIKRREESVCKIEVRKKREQQKKKEVEEQLKTIGEHLTVLFQEEKRLQIKERAFETIMQKRMANKRELETLKDLKYDAKAYDLTKEKIADLKPKYEALLKLESVISALPIVKKELEEIDLEIVKTKEDIKNKEQSIKEHRYDVKADQKQELLYERLLKDKDEIQSKLSHNKVEAKKIEGKIENIKNILRRDEHQRALLQHKIADKSDYEKLKAFMVEFKNRVNAQIAPRISQLASEMFATITRGKYQHIEVSNAFDFSIYDEGVKYPIERFSGGEVDLANLVLRIAISKTLSELNGSGGVGFLAFDEVFGSQDEERRFEIMEAFHTIKEQYRQIFLISHEREIKEMFERVVVL
jgi:exonuclease SbcC